MTLVHSAPPTFFWSVGAHNDDYGSPSPRLGGARLILLAGISGAPAIHVRPLAVAACLEVQALCRGPVAQGIEQQPSKLKVAGSNPAGVATLFLLINCHFRELDFKA